MNLATNILHGIARSLLSHCRINTQHYDLVRQLASILSELEDAQSLLDSDRLVIAQPNAAERRARLANLKSLEKEANNLKNGVIELQEPYLAANSIAHLAYAMQHPDKAENSLTVVMAEVSLALDLQV